MLREIIRIQLLVEEAGTTAKKFIRKLAGDDDGASMLEYSVLIGIILGISLALVLWAGQWANAQWNSLQTTLSSTPVQPG